MSIRTRLLAGLTIVGIAFAIVAALAVRDLNAAQQRTEAMRRESLEPVMHLRALRSVAEDAVNYGALVRQEPAYAKAALKGLVDGDAQISTVLDALKAYDLPPSVQKNLDDLVWITSGMEKSSNSLLHTNMRIMNPDAPEIAYNDQGPALNKRSADVVEAVKTMEAKEAAQEQALVDTYQEARRNLIIALLGAAGVAVAVALVIARQIVRPVRRTVTVLEQVAEGDLTPRLDTGKDEIGQMGDALNRTLDQVGSVIEAIDSSATELSAKSTAFTERSAQLASAAATVAEDAEAASTGVHGISGGIAGVAAASEEMVRAVDVTAEHARAAAPESQRATDLAETARRSLAEAAAGGDTAQVRAGLAGAAGALDELASVVDRIGALQGRLTTSADVQSVVATQVSDAVADVATSSGSVDDRVQSVALAVEMTSLAVEDSDADARRLAELSDQLETLTAVFTYQRA